MTLPNRNRCWMLPTPFFIWTKTDTNLESRNDNDAEEKSAALSASSVSNFSEHGINGKSHFDPQGFSYWKISHTRLQETWKVFSAFQYTISGMLSELQVERWICTKLINTGNPLTLQPWSKNEVFCSLVVQQGSKES